MADDWRIKHGEYSNGKESPEHYIWRGMLRRKKNSRSAKYYENVEVCDRWLSFDNFLADMGRRPTENHSLDRINNGGNYEPENCRWATRSEQQKNKSSTRRWAHGGREGTLYEWAAILGISPQLAIDRWKRWGTFEKGKVWELLPKAGSNEPSQTT